MGAEEDETVTTPLELLRRFLWGFARAETGANGESEGRLWGANGQRAWKHNEPKKKKLQSSFPLLGTSTSQDESKGRRKKSRKMEKTRASPAPPEPNSAVSTFGYLFSTDFLLKDGVS